MRQTRRYALCVSAIVAGLAAAPRSAHADWAYITGIAGGTTMSRELQNDADTNRAQILDAIRAEQDAIIQALQKLSGQNTINARSQTQASSQMRDTADARIVQSKVEDWKMRALAWSSAGASVCNVVTGAIGGENISEAVSQWREQINQQQLDFYLGNTSSTASSMGPAAANAQRVSNHCQIGASPAEITEGVCPSGSPVKNDLAGKDLDFDTVFGAPNGVVSPSASAAANGWLMNTFGDKPAGALPPGTGQTSQALVATAAQRFSDAAQRSVAYEVGSQILADTKPMPSSTSVVSGSGGASGSGQTSLESWADGTAKQTLGYNPNGGNFPSGVSKEAFLRLRARGWFWNANWAAAVSTQRADATLKDIAMIDAFSVYQNWLLYRQVQQMNVTLATMLTIMNDEKREGR